MFLRKRNERDEKEVSACEIQVSRPFTVAATISSRIGEEDICSPFSFTRTQRKNSRPVLTSRNSTSNPFPRPTFFSRSIVFATASSILFRRSLSLVPDGASPSRVAWGGNFGPGRWEMREEMVEVASSERAGESQSE